MAGILAMNDGIRIFELQERLVFQERALNQLNRVVADQLELDALQREVKELRALKVAQDGGPDGEQRTLADDGPRTTDPDGRPHHGRHHTSRRSSGTAQAPRLEGHPLACWRPDPRPPPGGDPIGHWLSTGSTVSPFEPASRWTSRRTPS